MFWKKDFEKQFKKNLKQQISRKKKLKKSPKSGNNFIVPLHWISMRTGHLPDWSSPDDPARVLAAVNPSI